MVGSQGMSQSSVQREDVLVSACFGDLPGDASCFEAVESLAQDLQVRFRFREIVIVVEESRRDAYLQLVQRVANLRLLTVRDGTAFYRRRVIAAEEAIGDIVLLANAAELAYVDAIGMIELADIDQRVVLAIRACRIVEKIISAPLIGLGRMAGFKLALRDLQTMAVPRTLLNQLLIHPDPELALRFPPRDVRVPLSFSKAASEMPVLRENGQVWRRLMLMQKLLIYLAPTLLLVVTLASGTLAFVGFFYALYVLGAWVLVDDLTRGWLTLSAMLSITAFFMGVSIMGMSLGLQQLLTRANRDGFDAVVSEVNRTDLFGQVASDLNVDVEREYPEPPQSAHR